MVEGGDNNEGNRGVRILPKGVTDISTRFRQHKGPDSQTGEDPHASEAVDGVLATERQTVTRHQVDKALGGVVNIKAGIAMRNKKNRGGLQPKPLAKTGPRERRRRYTGEIVSGPTMLSMRGGAIANEKERVIAERNRSAEIRGQIALLKIYLSFAEDDLVNGPNNETLNNSVNTLMGLKGPCDGTTISRILITAFGKQALRFLSDKRIEDMRTYLSETDSPLRKKVEGLIKNWGQHKAQSK